MRCGRPRAWGNKIQLLIECLQHKQDFYEITDDIDQIYGPAQKEMSAETVSQDSLSLGPTLSGRRDM